MKVCENLKITAALLSRFDLVFVLLDRPDENRDRLISEHIMRTTLAAPPADTAKGQWQLSSQSPLSGGQGADLTLSQSLHRQSAQFVSSGIPHGLFREYIAYARRYCHPRLTPAAAKVLQRLYLGMRTRSQNGDSIPVTTRHLESLVRLAQARAKMELRQTVVLTLSVLCTTCFISRCRFFASPLMCDCRCRKAMPWMC